MTQNTNKDKKSFCHACGKELPVVGAAFCTYCGEKLSGSQVRRSQFVKFFSIAISSALVLGAISFAITRSFIPKPASAPPAQQAQSTEQPPITPEMEKTMKLTNDSLKQTPNNFDLVLRAANLFYDAGLMPASSALYKRYLRDFDSTSAEVRVDYALTLSRQGEQDGAIVEMKHVLDFAPNHPIAMFNLGVLYFHKQEKEESRKWLEKCLKLSPDSEVGKKSKEFLDKL